MNNPARFLSRVADLYIDGFRNITWVGRRLWILIIVKLIVVMCVLKLFFFPDILQNNYDTDAERAQAVRENLIHKR